MGKKKQFDENAFWDRLKETQKEAIKIRRIQKENAKNAGEPWPELPMPKHWIRKIKKRPIKKEVYEQELVTDLEKP